MSVAAGSRLDDGSERQGHRKPIASQPTNLLDSADSGTTLSSAIPIAVPVHDLGRLVHLLPAALLRGLGRLVALPFLERDFSSEVAEMIETLGSELASLNRGEHRAAWFRAVRAVAE